MIRLARMIAFLSVSLLAGCMEAAAAPQVPFSNLYCGSSQGPCSGRVGYHTTLFVTDSLQDEPGQPCHWKTETYYDDTVSQLRLPPGITVDADNSLQWEGTPRQAGDWYFVLKLDHVHCTEGPDQQDYGSRTVQVTIHIDP